MSGLTSRLSAILQGPSHRWWVLASVECGNFVVYMDAFIVTLALPAMAREFHLGLHEVKWVLLANLVSLAATLLVAGRLADCFGRKTITTVGMGALALGSLLCFLAPSFSVLIACRVLQGIGGALVLANVMAGITGVFPKEERRLAMAYNSSVLALGQVVGLLAGGVFIESFGWRSIFLLILAVTFIGLVLDVIILRNHLPATPGRMDGWGTVLSLLIVGVPFFIIERLATSLAHPVVTLLSITGALLLLGIFIIVEWKHPSPLIDLRLFRLRAFVCGSVAVACYFVAATSAYFLIPLYAQTVMGFSPFQAGLLMLPLAVALTTFSQLVGRFSKKYPARVISTFGLLCTTAAVYGLSCLSASASLPVLAGLLFLIGIGGGLFHAPNNTSVLAAVPHGMLGSANGFFTTARIFGQALGVSLGATILVTCIAHTGAAALLSHTGSAPADPALLGIYTAAQDFAFRITASFGLAGIILSACRGPAILTSPPEDLSGKPAANS